MKRFRKLVWDLITLPFRFVIWLVLWIPRRIISLFKKGWSGKCLGCLILLPLTCVLGIIVAVVLALAGIGLPMSTLQTAVIKGPGAAIETLIPEALSRAAATAVDAVAGVGEAIVTQVAPPTNTAAPTTLPYVEEFCQRVPVKVDEVLESGTARVRSGPSRVNYPVVYEPRLGEDFEAVGLFFGR